MGGIFGCLGVGGSEVSLGVRFKDWVCVRVKCGV